MVEKKSPNLVVVSRFPGQGKGEVERRRLRRLSLTSEQFRDEKSGKVYSISDISEKGMGFWLLSKEDAAFFELGSLFKGSINLQKEKYPIAARVRSVVEDRVGCEFETLAEEAVNAIRNLSDPKILASELKPVPDSERNAVWYHGPSGTDLLFYRSFDGNFSKVIIYILGEYIQWDSENGLRTGISQISDEASSLEGILRLETRFLREDATPDPAKLEIAKTLILSSNLTQDLKNFCARSFNLG